MTSIYVYMYFDICRDTEIINNDIIIIIDDIIIIINDIILI